MNYIVIKDIGRAPMFLNPHLAEGRGQTIFFDLDPGQGEVFLVLVFVPLRWFES
jgi:hypothetical protein